MESLREIKTRKIATQKTAQITSAMNMVSTSKLRRAEKQYKDYIDYLNRIMDCIRSIACHLDEKDDLIHGREVNKVAYLVITSDRGLAGSYNSNIYKAINNEIKDIKTDYIIASVGKKGYYYCRQKGYNMMENGLVYVRDEVEFHEIQGLAHDIIAMYLNKEVDRKQRLFCEKLLKIGENDLYSVSKNFINFHYKDAIDSSDENIELSDKYKNDFPDFLYDSLIKFEELFAEFLNDMLPFSIKKDDDFFFDESDYLKKEKIDVIITYNYTKYVKYQFKDSILKYMHGKLEQTDDNHLIKENIIFGIDINQGTNYKNEKYNYFKKDYRRDAYNTDYSRIMDDLKGVSRVIVYGHSMNRVDYDSLKIILNTCYKEYKGMINGDNNAHSKFELCIFYHKDKSKNNLNNAIRNILEKNIFDEIKFNDGLKFFRDCKK